MALKQLSPDDVFINCPFDADFKPIFNAIVFTIYACGFRPRSALELDDNGQSRLEKLYAIIAECRYGVHDLSRTQLDTISNLPRFNMPLELGLFLGAKRYGNRAQHEKRLLILDIERYRYQMFISDLAGMDIHSHDGEPTTAVRETRNWLANVSRRQLPGHLELEKLFLEFSTDLPKMAEKLKLDIADIRYADFERIVAGWLLKAREDS